MFLSESRIRTGHGKSVGKTENQADSKEPCHVDPDGGCSKLEWHIVLNDDILEWCLVGDADESLSYLPVCGRCYNRIQVVQVQASWQ